MIFELSIIKNKIYFLIITSFNISKIRKFLISILLLFEILELCFI